MPVVPKVTRQVQLDALPGVRLTAAETPESEGVGIAEAKAQQGQALAGIGAKTAALGEQAYGQALEEQQQIRDNTAVLEGRSGLLGWVNKRYYDPNTGAVTVRGKDALGLPDKVMGEYDQQADQIAATMTTPRQKMAFAQARAEIGASLANKVSEHATSQVQQYQAGTLQAFVTNSREFALSSGDAVVIGEEIRKQTDAIQSMGKSIGLGPDQITEQVNAARSAVHVGQIENLLAQEKTKSAQVYFDAAKDQINGDQLARLERALKEGSTRKEGQVQSDAIIAAGGTEAQQREKARQIDDADVRDQVTTRIEHEWSIKKAQQRDDDEAVGDAGIKALIKYNGDLSKAIPPTTWASASGAQQKAWKAYADALSKGEPVETNLATYDVLERLATSPDPAERQKFAEMNLNSYAGLISKVHLVHFFDVQGAIRKGDPAKVTALTANDSVVRQIVDGNLVGLGVNPNPPVPGKNGYDKEASDRVLAYRRAVRDAVAVREFDTKKKLTEPEVQDIADSLMAQTAAAKTHWFSANEPAQYAFETPDRGVTQAADVPASERTQIEAALKRAGLPITDTAVVNLFNQHLQSVRGKPR